MKRKQGIKRANRIRASARSRERRKRDAEDLARVRQVVIRRASNRCERCRCDFTFANPPEAHHIVPRSQARGYSWLHAPENLALLCRTCHAAIHERRVLDWKHWLRNARDMEEGHIG